ncbi:D-alanyl-D-alanine carboxypeptidase/D-alanyl-D-alanine-endopeptidase [Actinomadura geliboluensis]|uniref:D-alanyl-D-alanine carboxypeptidase/D-alanyl-D-alanine-endopeptidase n=1 Tax=Actinomadura geliboluensis TaxID=882440 RepID=A0A5S4HIG0_9ACTN|nr:D-alanyl-D-alanine carboxypeptidase/D-alanyl-D-alanine-endopeptidase [Actinomadura geliboluensis]TMR38790.1 D-alanyl-D-alanine carboxypeptidase/D-alanyl-D-alanine-endopeptidase [Actinomadura geliboluensis]
MLGHHARIPSVLIAGVVALTAPAVPARAAAPGDLRTDLDAILADPRLDGAAVGVVVRDARSGAVRYARGAGTPVLPASNLKLYTSSAALSLLGTGYRFRTSVHATAVSGSSVKGNLYLKGTGDPTTRAADYDRLAAEVAAKGVRRVEGDLVADDTWFDAVRTPSHWDPDDLQYYYAAPISALTVSPNDDFDAGTVDVSVRPGAVGKPVRVGLSPATGTVKIANRAVTGRAGSPSTLEIDRAVGSDTIVVSGSYPADAAPLTELRTVRKPTLYAADVFRRALRAHGVQVKGDVERGRTPAGAAVLASRASMPLSRLMVPFLKLSNNMIAEILVKAIGRKAAGQGSWDAGLPVIERYARSLGVPSDRLEMADGSGLSRRDRTTAGDVSTLLERVRTAPWFPAWYRALPVAGDPDRTAGGTLASRMRGTPAAGNVHAKTGTLTGATALSGYVTGPAGRPLVFSVILNGYAGGAPKDVEDRIAVRLAGGTPPPARRRSGTGQRLECSWAGSC